jgi:KDO2-lipid IV(A) lauroyltransferase
MTPTEKEVLTYSYYRDGEIHGSGLLYRLLRWWKDPNAQVMLSEHLADETRHAWLWTQRIQELGATPVEIEDGYQTRIGKKAGMVRNLVDLLALTVVVEQRALRRYTEHLKRPDVSERTREVLDAVSKDEGWHSSPRRRERPNASTRPSKGSGASTARWWRSSRRRSAPGWGPEIRHPSVSSLLARLRASISIWGVWILLALLGRLPRSRAVQLGGAAGAAWARLGLPRTETALVNLRIAFPHWSEDRRRQTCRRAFANLGRGVAELAFINRLTPENLDDFVRFEGFEHLEQARRSHPAGSAIALSAHYGNWELLAVAVALRGVPISVVQREQSPGFDALVRSWREGPRSVVLPRGSAARATLRALREGRVVAMLLDQDAPRQEGIFVPFFGRLACTRDAPARIAMRTGVPVVPVFIQRLGEGDRHTVRFQPPLPMEPPGDEPEQATRTNVLRMNQAIEQVVREDPEQWIWDHRRWKTQPAGEARPYASRRSRRRAAKTLSSAGD